MFDLFRSREKSVRYLLGAVLLVIAASMVWFLIPGGGMGGFGSNPDVIATVGGEQITAQDVQRAIQNITRNQSNLPRELLAMYVPSIVNQMIESKAMAYQARQMGFRISDDELASAIQQQFVSALGRNFDMKTYEMILAEQGLTPEQFESQQRESMLAARLENLEAQSAVVTDQEARAEYQRKNLKVALDYIEFENKDFVSKVNKDPAAIKAYFDSHRYEFRIPEERNAELIIGSTADFLPLVQVSDAQLHQMYEENLDNYRFPERAKVRHILIKTEGKSPQQAAEAKARAEDILKQLQHGADFAALAKKYSEDPGSADKGGELGWIVRGQTVKNFENTAFSLQPGQLSGLVQTEYGYHIIQVEAKEAAHTETFEEAKPQLLVDAKKQSATDEMTKAVQAARNEILRNPSQAEAIAAKYHLKCFKLDKITSSSTLPDLNSQPQVNSAIFSAPAGGVTDIVNLDAQGKDVFAVVTHIFPARNANFDEVQQEVTQKYIDAEAAKLAQQAAAQAAARARQGESLEAIARQEHLTVKTAAPFTIDGAAEGIGSATLLAPAFRDPVGAIVGPISAQSAEFVCKVTQKIPADMSKFSEGRDAIVQDLASQRQNLLLPLFRDSVVAYLTQHGKIRINTANYKHLIDSYKS
jgi:peptidyl-prolyl cis-trans isomerase D